MTLVLVQPALLCRFCNRMLTMTKTPPVLVFDGVCNLCHGAVRFILRWEQDSDIVFAPAQSEAGQALMAKYGVSALANDTVFLIDDGQCPRQYGPVA